MENTYFFVLNPVAGGRKAEKNWDKLSEILEAEKIPYVVKRSENTNHIPILVREAIEQGYRKFIGVGGDGTINEIVNGIFSQTDVPTTEIQLGAIPLGTGNDWVKTHKIPKDIRKAVEVIKNGKIKNQDIGKITYQKGDTEKLYYFNNVAGMAYDGFVAKQTLSMDKSGAFSKLFYLWLVVKMLWKYEGSEFTIASDTFSYTGNVFCINIGLCRYSGGGMQTVPESIPDDGLFDITIIESMPRFKLLWEIRRLYLGNLYGCKQILLKRSNHFTVISKEKEKDLEADGEWLGYAPVTFEIKPKALQIIVNS